MGYMRHHAIVVTSGIGDFIEKAHAKAEYCFPWVSPISPSAINGYQSFFVPPDGSKEGWEDSDLGDVNRKLFFEWLESQQYGDDSSPFDWVCVQYGDDDLKCKVVRDSQEPLRRRRKKLP